MATNILRNHHPLNKITPETLENTREPSAYLDAAVAGYNSGYSAAFSIDPAKARVVNVHKNSFKNWLADVTLGEDIYDENGKFIKTNLRTTEIMRTEIATILNDFERLPGETAYATRVRVAEELDLEPGELTGGLALTSNQAAVRYYINDLSLNYYGHVDVRFVYPDPIP